MDGHSGHGQTRADAVFGFLADQGWQNFRELGYGGRVGCASAVGGRSARVGYRELVTIIHTIDIIIIAVYFCILVYIGKRASASNDTQEEYFTAGRSFTWLPIGVSIIATWTSAAAFISAPGWVYQDGLRAYIIILNIPLVMLLCSAIFIPFVYNLRIISVYEYLEERFGGIARSFVAVG